MTFEPSLDKFKKSTFEQALILGSDELVQLTSNSSIGFKSFTIQIALKRTNGNLTVLSQATEWMWHQFPIELCEFLTGY